MSLKKVDLNLFLVFDAIYTERNLTRAAEVLNITQPAVSNALNRLRQSLNDPLFVRGPREMLPTPVAENMIAAVREALQLLNSSIQLGDLFEPARAERSFSLSMHDVLEVSLLPELMLQLEGQAPHIHLNSFSVDRPDIAKELAAGTLDLAIDAPLLGAPELLHASLLSSPYVCVVREDHPLATAQLDMDSYLSLNHILISSRRRGVSYVDGILERQGHKREVKMRMRHYLVAIQMVARSNYAMTVPRHLAENTSLKILELPFEIPPQEWHLYWHRSADQDRANTWLRQQILQQFVHNPGT